MRITIPRIALLFALPSVTGLASAMTKPNFVIIFTDEHSQSDFFLDLFPTRQGFDYFYGTPTSHDRGADLYRNEQ